MMATLTSMMEKMNAYVPDSVMQSVHELCDAKKTTYS